MKTSVDTINIEKLLIYDIQDMAIDSECRLFVGADENTTTEEALKLCKLPESVIEYQKEIGCNYDKIMELFDSAVQSSNLISMLLVRVEGAEIFRYSNYQILTADKNKARNYIIDETGRIEYEIAVFKDERNKKCNKALLESLVGHEIQADYRLPSFEDRIGLDDYDEEIKREGQQVVVGNSVGMMFFNHYLEEKKQELDNEINLLEKKITMSLFNEAIEGVILHQDGHFIVSRMTSRIISNLREELIKIQEDYDYESRIKEIIGEIESLSDIYYLKVSNVKEYYSFNRKKIIKFIKEEIVELKNKECQGTDSININCFILDSINTNISEEIVHSLLVE